MWYVLSYFQSPLLVAPDCLQTHGALFWGELSFALFLSANNTFTPSNSSARGVLTEVACAPRHNCNTDELAFRAVLARALANREMFVPDTGNTTINGQKVQDPNQSIKAILQASALGAAAQCSGGSNGTVCGSDWSSATWDGTSGLGQYLSALEVMLAILPQKPLLTVNTTTNATITIGSSSSSTGNGSASASPITPSSTGSRTEGMVWTALAGIAIVGTFLL